MAKKDGKSTGKFAYRLNGHIGTQGAFSFKYGFAAARIKFQKSRGQHGAFWMQPAASVEGATDPRLTGAEIDVIEYFGDKHPEGGLTSFVYSKNSKGQGVKTGSWIKDSTSFLTNKRDGWSKNYHVFSVEWTPRVYIFRIDGQETYRTKVGVSGQPQYPILSMLASDYEISKIGNGQQAPPVDERRLDPGLAGLTARPAGHRSPAPPTTRRPAPAGRRVVALRRVVERPGEPDGPGVAPVRAVSFPHLTPSRVRRAAQPVRWCT